MAEEKFVRRAVYEMDFISNFVVETGINVTNKLTGKTGAPSYKLKPELVERFKTEVLGDLWHTESDTIEYIVIYNDGTANVQRRKQKYNFTTKESYFQSYVFKAFTVDDVVALKDKIEAFLEAQRVVNQFQINDKITSISQEHAFWDSTLTKRITEKQNMLNATDWRVLPDIADNYPGEKDNWIKWRAKVRDIGKEYLAWDSIQAMGMENFDIEWFRGINELKWPMDPKVFAKQFPDRVNADKSLTGYLDTDDCFVKRDTDASTDLILSRITNISELSARWNESRRVVSDLTKEIMQMMRCEEFVDNGIDYTTLYTQEEIDALGEE